MQGYIKKGSVVGQDFSFFKWDNEEQIFNLKESTPTRYKCTADSYGTLCNGKYGNGSIYVLKENVVVITPPIRENDKAY